MKRKIYAVLLSLILVVGMTMSAMASGVSGNDKPAPTPEPTPEPIPQAVVDAAKGATVSVSGLNAAPVTLDRLNSFKDLLENNTDNFNTTYGIPATAQIAATFELKLKNGESVPEGGLIVPIKVKQAQAGDYIIIMHRKADGIWEVVGRGFLGDDLTLNATFTSFSPVMVLKVAAEDVPSGGIKAPKTGQ
jgi:hypothetical protein